MVETGTTDFSATINNIYISKGSSNAALEYIRIIKQCELTRVQPYACLERSSRTGRGTEYVWTYPKMKNYLLSTLTV